MKRLREEEEEEEIIAAVDHITDTLPREMVGEVFHAMRVTAEEKNAGWHLNSVGEVSHLLYESIKQVARSHFIALVAKVRADFDAWGGYAIGRPMSLHERFDDSIMGRMGLSFPWCMRQCYTESMVPVGDALALRGFGTNVLTKWQATGAGWNLEENEWRDLDTFFDWLVGANNVFGKEQRPMSWMSFYLYVRYSPFPEKVQRLLDFSGRHGSKENDHGFRELVASQLVVHWMYTAIGNKALFMEWLHFFHCLKFHMSNDTRSPFFAALLKHVMDCPLDFDYFGIGAVEHGFLSEWLVLDINQEIKVEPYLANAVNQIITSVGIHSFTSDRPEYNKWHLQGYDPEKSIIPRVKQWLFYKLRQKYGSVPFYARWVLQSPRANVLRRVDIWNFLANLPVRPQDPPPSGDIREKFGTAPNAMR
jgi:hypothetical protein